MKKFIATITAIIALVFFPMGLDLAHAQSNGTEPGSGQGLEIGPPLIRLSGDPGEILKARISLRDVTKANLIITNEINDFEASGETGAPRLIIDPTEDNPYSMREWIKPLPQINLVPDEVKTVEITINIPQNASPGGYFSVIRFTGTPPDLEDQGVALSASVGALVLLQVKGEVNEGMSLETLGIASKDGENPTWLIESAPFKFIERVKNFGNLHEQPQGRIIVTDIFGNKIAEIPVNDSERSVLPGSIRRFEQHVTSEDVGNMFMFGMYNAKLELTYGASVIPLNGSLTFFVIPYRIIGIILGVLVVLGIALRLVMKRYKKQIVKQSSGRRR